MTPSDNKNMEQIKTLSLRRYAIYKEIWNGQRRYWNAGTEEWGFLHEATLYDQDDTFRQVEDFITKGATVGAWTAVMTTVD